MDFESNINSIAEWCGGELLAGKPDRRIMTITTDSRNLGRESLFVPIIGEKYDGHKFIDDLVKDKSIAGFLTMREEHRSIAEENDISGVLCDDTLKAYGRIASRHRDETDALIIGITGTNGKTTTKEILWSVLNKKKRCLKNEKNYNNEIGVPFTLLGLKEDHHWAVIEMGMNHMGEIDRLSKITKPDIAVITNVGEGHLEFLGSVENVARAKSEIMNGMAGDGTVFLNKDIEYFDIIFEIASGMGLKIISFGLSEEADFYPDKYEVTKEGVTLIFKEDEFFIPIYGIHSVYNVLAAVSIAFELGIESNIIKDALSEFKTIDMRSQVIDKGYIIINDTYNSNPLSSKFALESLSKIFQERRKIAVLSDMKELGDSAYHYHHQLGGQVYKYGIDVLFTWGDSARDIKTGAENAGMSNENICHYEFKEELIASLREKITINDAILIKGSRSMKMEEVAEALIH